jgi:hypothetical protein
MYRGLVQHGAYITPYLKEQTLLRKLDQPVHRGRIWRIVPQGWKPAKTRKLSEASSTELITYLAHADGWYGIWPSGCSLTQRQKHREAVNRFCFNSKQPFRPFSCPLDTGRLTTHQSAGITPPGV